MKKLVRIGLSIFIVFHLMVIFTIPNSQSLLGSQLAFLVEPYASFFEFMTSWNFFAPDPGAPFFLEWELVDKNGRSLEMDQWPPTPDPYYLRERQNRRMAAVRFMFNSSERASKLLVPYLCGKDSRVFSVRLWKTVLRLPSMEEVAAGRRTIWDDLGKDRQGISHTFCREING